MRMNRGQARNGSSKRQVSARLSGDLKTRYNARTLAVRTGDSVRVIRGEFSGLEGKIDRIDRTSGRVFVEGMTREKTTAGTSSRLSVHASKVMVTNLNLSDKWRSSLLGDRAKSTKEEGKEASA
ncbi:MAG TPA: 50S ribosomal protein L24 [Candidatus Binatus sp.]|nr:50S ribosomal protein L24 [Candidatus Binatus sp.]